LPVKSPPEIKPKSRIFFEVSKKKVLGKSIAAFSSIDNKSAQLKAKWVFFVLQLK
jgi:hypothetical protein